MMDQYNDEYKNQYRKETSQIHAPADLIQKTKLAAAEEEKRLQAESAPQTQRQESMEESGNNRQRHYGKVYRWALPAAAAAVLLLVLNVSVMLRESGTGMARTDSASGAESGGSYVADEDGSIEAFDEDFDGTEMSGDTENPGSTANSGGIENTEGAANSGGMEDAAAEDNDSADIWSATVMENEINDAQDELADMYAEADRDDSSLSGDKNKDRESAASELSRKYSKEEDAIQITVTEAKSMPGFCDDPDTKCMVSRGLTFYVAEDVGAERAAEWKAYTEYGGRKYIMTGQAANQEDFLEKAYEILMETVKEP